MCAKQPRSKAGARSNREATAKQPRGKTVGAQGVEGDVREATANLFNSFSLPFQKEEEERANALSVRTPKFAVLD